MTKLYSEVWVWVVNREQKVEHAEMRLIVNLRLQKYLYEILVNKALIL